MAYVHHLAIHFPIAFATLAALLALYGLVTASTAWVRAASALTYLTALAAVVAAASGLLSAGHFVEGGGDGGAVALHRNVALGSTAVLLVAALLSWRATRAGAGAESRGAAAASILGAVVISGAGHFGGEMLHPGMAPWSGKAHSHGPTSAAGADDGHGHSHDPAASASSPADAHADDHDHAAEPTADASTATPEPAPPGHKNDHAH